jgi:hypothetical protein
MPTVKTCSCWACRAAACLSRTKWPARSARRWDVFVVRKLGVPGHEELAMGAVATGGVLVLNDQFVERLGIPEQMIDAVAARERQELARRVAHVSRQHLVHQHVGRLYGCAADTHCTELLLF